MIYYNMITVCAEGVSESGNWAEIQGKCAKAGQNRGKIGIS